MALNINDVVNIFSSGFSTVILLISTLVSRTYETYRIIAKGVISLPLGIPQSAEDGISLLLFGFSFIFLWRFLGRSRDVVWKALAIIGIITILSFGASLLT